MKNSEPMDVTAKKSSDRPSATKELLRLHAYLITFNTLDDRDHMLEVLKEAFFNSLAFADLSPRQREEHLCVYNELNDLIVEIAKV